MKIDKVYNNNVVQVLDNHGRELIVMGKGLGFQKRTGDDLDESKIEKTFASQNDHQVQDLLALNLTMKPGELEVVNQIALMAEQTLDIQLDLSFYIALGDHLNFVFQRSREGLEMENPLAWEVRKFYPQEYQIGLDSLDLIRDKLGLDLDKVEAASIALHIINAQKNGSLGRETQKISRIVGQILSIVRLHFGQSLDEDDTSYHRFVTHVQYFAQRVANGKIEGANDAFLYEQVKANYPSAFECTQKIRRYISAEYDFEMSKDEQVYLTIHIQRLKPM